jgi:hypothetical protein
MKDIMRRFNSGLRDKELNMYFLSASLKDRATTWVADRFCPWLAIEPVDLDAHVVQVLPSLWKLFTGILSEMKGGGILPFMDPDVYGRLSWSARLSLPLLLS